MTTSRLETFADGVFAIAATLLILDVHPGEGPLGEGLLHAWPSYAAYAVSFLTIGVIWVNHQRRPSPACRRRPQVPVLERALPDARRLHPVPDPARGRASAQRRRRGRRARLRHHAYRHRRPLQPPLALRITPPSRIPARDERHPGHHSGRRGAGTRGAPPALVSELHCHTLVDPASR